MGVVYLANELNTDRYVAVKFVTSGPFALPSDRGRWLREARLAARIQHHHIVQIHGAMSLAAGSISCWSTSPVAASRSG